jgi:hypothetical protein
MTTYTVTATATDAATDRITVSSATNMFSGLPIVFSGSVFGGITAGATYYIGTVVPGSPTSTITVTSLPGGAIFALSTAAGSMTGTFSSGGQQIIDIGTAPNDGTGDPLRTAFNDTNLNFDQVFAAGPVGSNVQIANNTIKTIDTNGNLVLAPNGTGTVQSNVSILPNQANIRNLGSAAQRWSTIYTQYLDVSANLNIAGNIVYNGDLTVDGNLTVQGNIIQVGNIVTETLTIQLANAASTANAANGAGITVGANDDIATLIYNSTGNVWTTNIGLSSVGNISAPYFFGNGSQLTGLVATYGNSNVVTLLSSFGNNTVSTTGNISGGFILGNGSQLTGLPATYGNANVAIFLAAYGSNTVSSTGNITTTANVSGGFILGNVAFANGLPTTYGNANVVANLAALGSNPVSTTGNVTGAYIKGNGSELTNLPAPTVTQDITSNGAMSIMTYDGVIKYVNYATVEPSSGNIAAGNVSTAGNVTGNFFIGDGSQLTGISTANTGNVTFNDVNIIGDGNLHLQPDPANAGSYLDIYLTTGPDIHIAKTDSNVILGSDTGANVTVGTNGNVYVQASTGTAQTWTFDTAGNLTLPGNIIGSGNILIAPDSASSSSYLDIYLTGGPDIHIASNDNSIVIGRDTGANIFVGNDGEVSIRTDNGVTSQVWNFDDAGNLTLPGNTFAVNYANGNRVTGGVTFDGEAVIGTGTSNTQSGLYLAPDPVSLANDLYLRVRGNILDEPTHIHFDTGNNQYFNQFIGDDNKYIQLANTGNIVINSNDAAGNSAQWIFNTAGTLTLPGGSRIRPLGANLDLFAGGGYVNLITADESSYMGVSGNGGFITTVSGTWQFDTTGNLSAPGNISAVGNVTAGNISAGSGTITGGNVNGANFNGNVAFGTGTVGGSGNITGGNLITTGSGGAITMTGGNITGVGNISAGNISATGNVTAANFFGNGNTLSNVATTFESFWTVPVGNSTQNFTVTASNTYSMWVDCNIPNGILTWNATATVTNTNVPVVGAQYAWVYTGGGTPIDFTSIPDQFVGTANTIIRSSTAPSATTNRFDFGINNTSGNAVTVRYGWAQIS